jgi:HNH endonuclease
MNAATDDFLLSYEWRRLRMEVLKRDGAKCRCCGATPETGAVMNVDHIKPRRTHPELALDPVNCQVLCNICNHGKGNWDQTNWRGPVTKRIGEWQLPKNMAPGPYLAIIRLLLQQPSLISIFKEEMPQYPSQEAMALDWLLGYLLTYGHSVWTTASLVDALRDTKHAAIYQRSARLIADLGYTDVEESEFSDALAQYRSFEKKNMRRMMEDKE